MIIKPRSWHDAPELAPIIDIVNTSIVPDLRRLYATVALFQGAHNLLISHSTGLCFISINKEYYVTLLSFDSNFTIAYNPNKYNNILFYLVR